MELFMDLKLENVKLILTNTNVRITSFKLIDFDYPVLIQIKYMKTRL